MAITTGTIVLDETSGIQSPGSGGDDGDANNNDFGVGSLAGITVPAPLNSILADALNEGGTAQPLDPATTTVALSGSTAADPDGDEILDFTVLGTTPIALLNLLEDDAFGRLLEQADREEGLTAEEARRRYAEHVQQVKAA